MRSTRLILCLATVGLTMWGCGDDPVDPPPPPPTNKTVVLEPSKDNTIYERDGSGFLYSNAKGEQFFTGQTSGALSGDAPRIRRGLLHFDLSGIPAGATIKSVSLRLYCQKNRNTDSTAVDLHVMSRDWGEGTSDATSAPGAGDTPTGGDVTWAHAFFDTTTWTTEGGDFAAPVSGSTLVATSGNFYTFESTSEMVMDCQNWLDNPTTNFGWILIGDETDPGSAKMFVSREGVVNTDRRPKLTVTYEE